MKVKGHSWHDYISQPLPSHSSVCMCVSRSVVSNSCDPMNCSLPGFSVHGILQARILEWVDIPFSRGSSPPRAWTLVSRIVGRFFTVWVTRKALSIQGEIRNNHTVVPHKNLRLWSCWATGSFSNVRCFQCTGFAKLLLTGCRVWYVTVCFQDASFQEFALGKSRIDSCCNLKSSSSFGSCHLNFTCSHRLHHRQQI